MSIALQVSKKVAKSVILPLTGSTKIGEFMLRWLRRLKMVPEVIMKIAGNALSGEVDL